jgi:pantoate--beta-alanine ligase
MQLSLKWLNHRFLPFFCVDRSLIPSQAESSGLPKPPLERTKGVAYSRKSMKTITSASVMQLEAIGLKRAGRTIGFVPTMGFLHEGHLSLMRIARRHADTVVASLFVNPTQFGPKEDFKTYPRDPERDAALCEKEGVDILFAPETATMYAADHSVYVNDEKLAQGLCGASRPGHFRGVDTIVAKLFNIVLPDIAVFGEKDAQQLRIIRRLVRDLNFPVKIVPGPTAREPDGLAMSSRNVLLTPEERQDALALRRSLLLAEELYAKGERSAAAIRREMTRSLSAARTGKVDYVEIVDDETLEPVEKIEHPVLAAVAVKFSTTRLIDNTTLGREIGV